MNKTEFKKIAKALVESRYEFYSKVRIIEMNSGRSEIDNMLFINYLVIINDFTVERCHVSEDEDNECFFKQIRMKENDGHKGIYNMDTLKQVY